MTTEQDRAELRESLKEYMFEHMDDVSYIEKYLGSQIVCSAEHYIKDKLLDDIFVNYPNNNEKFTENDFDDFYNMNEWLFNDFAWEHEGLMEIKNVDDINMFWDDYSYGNTGYFILEKFNFMCQEVARELWKQIQEWNKEEELDDMLIDEED